MQQDPQVAEPARRGGYGGLIAILVGIVLGMLIGAFYGRSMWVASGGLEREIQRLTAAAEQKTDAADELVEAARRAAEDGDAERAEA